MKKKALALICAMTMVLGMSMSVFAADSADSEEVASSAEESQNFSTGTQTITTQTVADMATVTTVSGATVTTVSNEIAGEAVAEANKLYGSSSFIASVVDINVPGATFPYELTINNPNVWAGQKVTVLHKVGDTWEKLTPSKVGKNTLTVTVNSFSPFAIAIDTSATSASPKTQDIVLMVGACAAVFAAGVAMTCKKREQR